MEEFQHFVITRFNLKNKAWRSDKNSHLILNEAWLSHRYNLFLKYCLPSLRAQSNKNFYWLIYFDSNTPEKFKDLNYKLQKKNKKLVILYKDNFQEFIEGLDNDIRKFLNKDIKYVITTRLDNDDALHKNAVFEIQNKFNFQRETIIEFKKGCCLQIEPKFKLSTVNFQYGPFLSLIEKVEERRLKTVLYKSHKDWFDVPYVGIDNAPFWLQVIHNKNLSNTLVGLPINSMSILGGFSVHKPFSYYFWVLKSYIKAFFS